MFLQTFRLVFVPGIRCFVLCENGSARSAQRSPSLDRFKASGPSCQNGEHGDGNRNIRNEGIVGRMFGVLGMLMRFKGGVVGHWSPANPSFVQATTGRGGSPPVEGDVGESQPYFRALAVRENFTIPSFGWLGPSNATIASGIRVSIVTNAELPRWCASRVGCCVATNWFAIRSLTDEPLSNPALCLCFA